MLQLALKMPSKLEVLDMMPKPRTLCVGAANFRLNWAVNSDDIEPVTPLSDKW